MAAIDNAGADKQKRAVGRGGPSPERPTPSALFVGADCCRVKPSLPGTAWVWRDGEDEPTRVRFGYPTDNDIADLANPLLPLSPRRRRGHRPPDRR